MANVQLSDRDNGHLTSGVFHSSQESQRYIRLHCTGVARVGVLPLGSPGEYRTPAKDCAGVQAICSARLRK